MLQKQVFPIIIQKGVDTKTDSRTSIPGKLHVLENAVMRKTGKVQKRPGCAKLGDSVVGATTVLSDADALGVFNEELLQFTKQSVYAYSENANTWVDKGAALSCRVGVKDIVKNNYEQTQVDSAVSGNIMLIAWEDSRGGIRGSVIDLESNTQLMADTQISAAGTRPRCAALGGQLVVVYAVSGDLRGRVFNPVNPSVGAETTISANLNSANPSIDLIAQDQYLSCVFNGAGTNIYFLRLSSGLSVLSTTSIAESAPNAITVIRGPESRNFIIWHTGTALRGAIYNALGSQTVAPFLIETLGSVEAVTGYWNPAETGVVLYYQVDAGATYDHTVRQATVTNAGAVSGVGIFLRSVGLAGKAFSYSTDSTNRGFVGIVHESTLQSTYFVARNDGLIVAKVAQGFAGGLLYRNQVPSLISKATGVFTGALLTKNPAVLDQGSDFLTFKGVSVLSVDFTDQATFSSVSLGDNSHLLGGVCGTYDGQSIVEHGFHLYPENITAANSTGGSLTLLGTYQYQVLYQWMDSKGQIHRSAPSAPLTVTLAGSENKVTLTIPTLRLTAKKSPRADVEIVVFRTEAGQTLFYRASSPVTLTYNDTTVDSVTYVDTLSDAALVAREPLYTTGDFLENDPPPSSAFGTVWSNRVILGGTEDDSTWISKERFLGAPVEFSTELTISLDPKGGRCTAVAALFDKLLIFKESAVFYIYGDGPDARGVGQWSVPLSATSDIGCVDSNSLAETSAGVFFKSRKGIYLIDPGLNVTYVGAQVEEWNDEQIVAAVVLADQNEVRFCTSEHTLVYNYVYQQWSVFTSCGANDAVIWKENYVYVRRIPSAAAIVCKEDPTSFVDVDQYYPMKIGFDWMAFAAIAGFQRIYSVLPNGEYKSPHKLRIQLAYDYSDAYEGDYNWNATSYLDASVYGGSSPYGDEAFYGGVNAPYMVKLKPARQKCNSLRVLIEDISPEGSGESFSLTSLSVELGIKRGSAKLAAEARI